LVDIKSKGTRNWPIIYAHMAPLTRQQPFRLYDWFILSPDEITLETGSKTPRKNARTGIRGYGK